MNTQHTRLIAAAPELLDVLHRLSMNASVIVREDTGHHIHAILAKARAAITKVTGASL